MVSVTRTVNITFKGVQRWKKGDVLHIDEHNDAFCVDVVNGHGIFLTIIDDFEHEFDFEIGWDSNKEILRKVKKFCKGHFLEELPTEIQEKVIPLAKVGFKNGLFRIPTEEEVKKYADEIENHELFALAYLGEDGYVKSGEPLYPWHPYDFFGDYFDALTVIFCVE
jgi:hypothetical protein